MRILQEISLVYLFLHLVNKWTLKNPSLKLRILEVDKKKKCQKFPYYISRILLITFCI